MSNDRHILTESKYSPTSLRRIYFYTATLLLLFCLIGSLVDQSFLKLISREDHFLENLTSGALLGSALYGLTNWRARQPHKNAIATFTALAFVGFLDEVSFGQRVFGFTAPMAGGTSLDGLHDLTNMLKKVISINFQYHPIHTFVVLFLIFSGFVITASFYRKKIFELINYLIRFNLAGIFMATISAILLSQLLDLEFIALSLSRPLEETLELIASLGLLTCLITLARSGKFTHKH